MTWEATWEIGRVKVRREGDEIVEAWAWHDKRGWLQVWVAAEIEAERAPRRWWQRWRRQLEPQLRLAWAAMF